MANFSCAEPNITSVSNNDLQPPNPEIPSSKGSEVVLQLSETVAFNGNAMHFNETSHTSLDVSSLCTCPPRRRTETPEQATLRRQRDRERKRQLRLQESSLETAIRRQKDALNKMKQRMMESPEQTAQRRAKDRERARAARRLETSEQAGLRREKNRLRKQELRRNLNADDTNPPLHLRVAVGDTLQNLLRVGLDRGQSDSESMKKENTSPS